MAQINAAPSENQGRKTKQIPAAGYYGNAALILKRGKWFFLLLASAILIYTFLFQKQNLSFENLQYIWRDLSVAGDRADAFASIVYQEQREMAFADFRGEFVVAGSDGVKMYDGSGSAVLREPVSYSSPVLKTGERYLLMYNADETEYALFSTLACVHKGSAEGRIQCAAVSDSGSYLIVSQSSEAKYVVTHYKSTFKEIARYPRDSYPIDITFSPKGDSFAIVETNSSGLALTGQLVLCKSGEEDIQIVSLGSLLPLRVQYFANGNIAVVCDTVALFFNGAGVEIARFEYPSVTLSCFDTARSGIVLVCSENVIGTKEHYWVLDPSGEIVTDSIKSERTLLAHAGTGSQYAYLVSGNSVLVLGPEGEWMMPFRGHVLSVCEIKDVSVLCTTSGIIPIVYPMK